MSSKQRTKAPKKLRGPNQIADLGLFNILDLDAVGNDDESDVDESTLEYELEALLCGKSPKIPVHPKKKVAHSMDIERMAIECLKVIGDEEHDDDDDEDESFLTDSDLLKELKGLSCESPETAAPSKPSSSPHVEVPEQKSVPSQKPSAGNIVTLLEERLNLYKEATAAAAKAGDNMKLRRYNRALKVLEQLFKTAKAGRNINEEDIPPVVNIPKAKFSSAPPLPLPSKPELSPEPSVESSPFVINNVPTESVVDIVSNEAQTSETINSDLCRLIARRNKYKVAALQAKRAGEKEIALGYLRTAKHLDDIIESTKEAKLKSVDFSNLSPSPPPFQAPTNPVSDNPKEEHNQTQSSLIEVAALSAASDPEDSVLFAAPPAPTSVLEALDQRLEKYKATKNAAEAEDNYSKVRRLDRIIKSYEKAIKDYKSGKPVDFEELPAPPGFAPISMSASNEKQKSSTVTPSSTRTSKADSENKVKKDISSVTPKRSAPKALIKSDQPQKTKVQRKSTSTVEKQLEFLLERQKMFRQAALASKQNGDIEQAKNYLRQSKGFDSMIEATKCGLPIDASSIPTPPQLESDFVIVDISECGTGDASSAELLEALESTLVKQIEVCSKNKEHFLKLGDVSSAQKFEKLELESRKDLSVICHLKKSGQAPPKFHYETRLFSIVQCHTDLSDNDLAVTVERGINLPGKPNSLDTYVRLEFPIPPDVSQKAKSNTIKDTNNPIFQEEFKFEINRKSRAVLRQFKRCSLKIEVWSKGGFLKSDSMLGTVNIKLVDLESKCTIHDSFDLMDGRKACGGKLEVKIRVHHPLLAKQVEEVREKWLVIGS